jgi:MoxR-like ATPase
MADGAAPTNWRIFTGEPKREPHNRMEGLPPPPPWRRFGTRARLVPPPDEADRNKDTGLALGAKFRCPPGIVEAVNTALYLRRPLLITGKPGNGKSSLVLAVASELRLGPVLHWPITSRSTLKDGLYSYDALGRLQELKRVSDPEYDSDIGEFIELGALGTALLPTDWPRAMLIDEIDKSDLDFPNDLLNIFEDGEYSIPELARARLQEPAAGIEVRTWRKRGKARIVDGYVRCTNFPFVVMTSNREREFPAAFLRRCVRITLDEPDEPMLGEIVESHFDAKTKDAAQELIKNFSTVEKTRSWRPTSC